MQYFSDPKSCMSLDMLISGSSFARRPCLRFTLYLYLFLEKGEQCQHHGIRVHRKYIVGTVWQSFVHQCQVPSFLFKCRWWNFLGTQTTNLKPVSSCLQSCLPNDNVGCATFDRDQRSHRQCVRSQWSKISECWYPCKCWTDQNGVKWKLSRKSWHFCWIS